MPYQVIFTKSAAKILQKMPRDIARSVRQKLDQIAADPFAPLPGIIKLQNRDGYRFRIGDWRVIYDIQKEKVTILVVKIATREEVYR
jgi:mRNA interferase RelE/StbE